MLIQPLVSSCRLAERWAPEALRTADHCQKNKALSTVKKLGVVVKGNLEEKIWLFTFFKVKPWNTCCGGMMCSLIPLFIFYLMNILASGWLQLTGPGNQTKDTCSLYLHVLELNRFH